MNYGLPYQGSKNRIAKRLVEALPPAPVLYDVFCGGCAVTHAAMLSGKYQHFVVNDLRGWLPDAFQKAIHGGYAPWAALCPETADALAAGLAPIEDRKQRRVQAGHFIVESLKQQLSAGTLAPDILDKPIYRQIRRPKHASESLESLERLERLERLQSLESLERLQSLQSLPGALTAYSMDYRELCFNEPGIIYCDPPYMSVYAKGKDYGCEFDAEAFYSWCEAQKLPVYISEYQMPEDRFVCVAEWDKVTTMAPKTPSHVTERLWRPRCQSGI